MVHRRLWYQSCALDTPCVDTMVYETLSMQHSYVYQALRNRRPEVVGAELRAT